MCFFRAPSPPPVVEVGQAPPPIAPTNPQIADSTPAKKDLVDPDEKAGVAFGTSAKKTSAQGKGATGANALMIKVNTGGGQTGVGANTGTA